mmetsp:Transcript_43949/g.106761  ORF Transcript_43949/g.106761 Transcript_43949/m.106761 type:complete len:251 (+) Transcript_43949:555-1307(+)
MAWAKASPPTRALWVQKCCHHLLSVRSAATNRWARGRPDMRSHLRALVRRQHSWTRQRSFLVHQMSLCPARIHILRLPLILLPLGHQPARAPPAVPATPLSPLVPMVYTPVCLAPPKPSFDAPPQLRAPHAKRAQQAWPPHPQPEQADLNGVSSSPLSYPLLLRLPGRQATQMPRSRQLATSWAHCSRASACLCPPQRAYAPAEAPAMRASPPARESSLTGTLLQVRRSLHNAHHRVANYRLSTLPEDAR